MLKGLKSLHLERSVLSPLMAVAVNIVMLYVVYTVARLEYLFENYSYFEQSVREGHLMRLLQGGVVFDTPGIMYTNVLYVLLMLLPLHWKENGAYHGFCKVLYVVVNSVALAMNLADSVYFRFTLRRTSAGVFTEFGNEDNLASIMGLELVRHWYLVLLAVVLVYGMWRLYFTPRIDIKRNSLAKYYLVQAASLVVAGVLCVSGIRGGLLNHWYQYVLAIVLAYVAYKLWKAGKGRALRGACAATAVLLAATAPIGGWRHRDIRPVALGNANEYTYRPTEVAVVLNTPFSVIRTFGKAVFQDPGYYPDKEELARIYNPVHTPRHKGMKKRKNVVVIIIESFGREYIGGFSKDVLGEDYQGYTPFTDSLMQHSVTYRYSFCNGRKSIDGMPSILSAIPCFIKPFVLTPQSLNTVGSFAYYLGRKGYQSAFFHGARTGSMGFNGFANSIGFKRYLGREDFDKDDRFGGDKDFDGYWAIWDEPFMQYYSLAMTDMKEPFVTALFTASSHHPFRIPDKYKDVYKEEELPIHKCIRYTDNALRQFFNTSRKQPWFGNTIFVITSDHTNQSSHKEFLSDIGGFSSPIIIYDPSGDLEPGMRDAVAQQTDLLPTILGYLGYDEPYLAFGCDLFSTPAAETWAVNYLNGVYQYVKYGYVMQFDGSKTVAMYRLDDYTMKDNLAGKVKQQPQMEKELKAIIQSYMDRMLGDSLIPSS